MRRLTEPRRDRAARARRGIPISSRTDKTTAGSEGTAPLQRRARAATPIGGLAARPAPGWRAEAAYFMAA